MSEGTSIIRNRVVRLLTSTIWEPRFHFLLTSINVPPNRLPCPDPNPSSHDLLSGTRKDEFLPESTSLLSHLLSLSQGSFGKTEDLANPFRSLF